MQRTTTRVPRKGPKVWKRGPGIGASAALLLLATGGCARPRAPASWPGETVSTQSPPAPVGQVTHASFVRDHKDSEGKLDELLVQVDRPIDPLTLAPRRFSIVGQDRRVMVIQEARFDPDEPGHQRIVLRGRFGDDPSTWARSLAVLSGLYGEDGVPIRSEQAIEILAPAKGAL